MLRRVDSVVSAMLNRFETDMLKALKAKLADSTPRPPSLREVYLRTVERLERKAAAQ
jgi:hypothetical protein